MFDLKKNAMLQTRTVEAKTLQLLKELQAKPYMSDFKLAGDTALSLYIGHRKSIDLDLFVPHPFNTSELAQKIGTDFCFNKTYEESNSLKGFISDIKLDLITYRYVDIASSYEEDGLRLYSIEDIIAMKLSAISGNGTRLKDFVDLAFLSKHYSLSQMLSFYMKKFEVSSEFIPLKALTYFNDIDFNESVILLNGSFRWKNVQRRLVDMSKNQYKVFPTYPISIQTSQKRGIRL